jgi:hypothetical protein
MSIYSSIKIVGILNAFFGHSSIESIHPIFVFDRIMIEATNGNSELGLLVKFMFDFNY